MQLTFLNFGVFKAVTPSDTILLTCRAIYIGGAGNIALSVDGVTPSVVITAPPVGTILPILLEQGRVMATGTTATAIVALL